MAPYVFVLAIQVLSTILDAQVRDGIITAPTLEDLTVSHIAFADDLMVFADVDKRNVRKVQESHHRVCTTSC